MHVSDSNSLWNAGWICSMRSVVMVARPRWENAWNRKSSPIINRPTDDQDPKQANISPSCKSRGSRSYVILTCAAHALDSLAAAHPASTPAPGSGHSDLSRLHQCMNTAQEPDRRSPCPPHLKDKGERGRLRKLLGRPHASR